MWWEHCDCGTKLKAITKIALWPFGADGTLPLGYLRRAHPPCLKAVEIVLTCWIGSLNLAKRKREAHPSQGRQERTNRSRLYR